MPDPIQERTCEVWVDGEGQRDIGGGVIAIPQRPCGLPVRQNEGGPCAECNEPPPHPWYNASYECTAGHPQPSGHPHE